MPIQFRRFTSEKQATDTVFNELRRYLSDGPGYHSPEEAETVGKRRATAPFVVMLAGGSTPLPVYERIAGDIPNRVHPAVHLMLSDDRHVPHTDPRSNAGAIAPTVRALGLPEERFVRVDTSGTIDTAVEAYSREIHDLAGRNAIFALALLGIGGDGHTASLFDATMITAVRPNDGNKRQTDSPDDDPNNDLQPGPGDGTLLIPPTTPAAMATGLYGGTQRISASPEVLLSFRKIVFFATGHGKREILYELSRRPEDYPAGALLLRHPNAEIWTEEAPLVR